MSDTVKDKKECQSSLGKNFKSQNECQKMPEMYRHVMKCHVTFQEEVKEKNVRT